MAGEGMACFVILMSQIIQLKNTNMTVKLNHYLNCSCLYNYMVDDSIKSIILNRMIHENYS